MKRWGERVQGGPGGLAEKRVLHVWLLCSQSDPRGAWQTFDSAWLGAAVHMPFEPVKLGYHLHLWMHAISIATAMRT